MSPIENLSDIRRLPRLDKIRLGIKKEGQKGPYPQAVDYFVCPDEVKAVYGDTPRKLDVMFPSNDLELVASQWYKCYSYTHGLICRGDGKHCKRKVDTDNGDFANRNTREWVLADGICEPEHCPMIGSKQCRRMMSLLFILPEVPGLGVYQLDTSSRDSIININSQLAPDGFIRQFTKGRIAFVPLILSLKPEQKTPMGAGRITVYVLHLTCEVKLSDIIRLSRQGPAQVLLPTLEEEEPPEDLYPEDVLAQAEETTEQTEVKADETRDEIAREAQVVEEEVKRQEAGEQEEPGEDIESAAFIDCDGFHIELPWLPETLRAIHWEEKTAKTWIASNFKVDTEGELTEVLARLTREEAERFTREINERADNVQPGLFQ